MTFVISKIHDSYLCNARYIIVLCRYIELEFNSNCKCISNVNVDCNGYNDVIDLGSRHRDYYVDIGIFSEVAELLLPTGSATSMQIQNKSP